MPQADLKYSNDLQINPTALLAEIERIIGEHDRGAGLCKGRAYPIVHYHHTHLLLNLAVLSKPHRDDKWMNSLLEKLERTISVHVTQPCHISVELGFLSPYYRTHSPH